ncbi:MAG: sulfite exporter TauE/SafE family protein [Micropepsaceae bacterium]
MAFLQGLPPGDLALLVAILAAAGLLAGLTGGMLGIGGGIVMVPVFYEILRAADVSSDVAMHVAVGTSLAAIVFNSLRSASAHARRGALDWDILKRYGPAVFGGAILGAILAAFIGGEGLKAFFGLVATLFAIYIAAAPLHWVLAPQIPNHPASYLMAAMLGVVSALMGIGGGTFGVTAMTLCGVAIHRAVATGAGLGVLIGAPAALGFVLLGLSRPDLPPMSIGYVSWGALLILAPASILAAPWGARIAHALPARGLRIVFGIFLAASGLRMLLG